MILTLIKRKLLLAGVISIATLAAQPTPGAGSIAGHVFDSVTGAPVRKATVRLMAGQNRTSLTAGTDAEGKFEFSALTPGTYVLLASHTGLLDLLSRRTTVSLGPDGHIADATIRLPPRSFITGRVVDEDGDPVDRAQVLLFKQAYRDGRKRWDNRGGSTTSDTGEYRFSNLTPGRYILRAVDQRPPVDNRYGSTPTMSYGPGYYPNALSQQLALPVDVGPGAELRDIDIHLSKVARPAAFHVRGKIIGPPRVPQIVVSLGLHTMDGEFVARTMANPPDYRFDLSAPPGQYTISANDDASDPQVYGAEPLTVAGDMADVMLALAPAPEMTGRILLAESGNHVGLQSLRVQLLDTFYHAHEARCDAAGRFVFGAPFIPGHYTINVLSVPGGFFVRDIRLGEQEIFPDGFEISASGQLEIVLSSTVGTIAGSVEDADGKPFPYSSVTLIPLAGRSQPSRMDVDSDGNFRFTGLRPGSYKLFAWEEVDNDLWQEPEFRKTYEDRSAEVTVGPRQTQTAKLRVIRADEMK